MGTYWLDAGGLFYCSFRDPAASTLVSHGGGPAPAPFSVGPRPLPRRFAPAAGGEHGFGNGWQRENLRGGAEFDRFAGHAVDHAGGLVLRDRAGAGPAHFQ